MKSRKRIVSLLLTVMLVVSMIPMASVSAESKTLVALGDSISTGYGLVAFPTKTLPNLIANQVTSNKKSPKNFVNRLASALDATAVNHAVDGYTSTDLLAQIPTVKNDIAKASYITITIGANDLLKPAIDAAEKKMVESKGSLTTLMAAIEAVLADKNAAADLQGKMQSNLLNFAGPMGEGFTGGKFDQAIQAIRKLNANARILVQTVYNPYSVTSSAINKVLLPLLESMNDVIKTHAKTLGYTAIDIYSDFEAVGALAPCTNVSNKLHLGDPHPNSVGHEMIFAQNFEAIVSPDITKITITKAKVTKYALNEPFDTTGIVVTAYLTDGTKQTLDRDQYEYSGFSSKTAGTKTVTITASGKKASYTAKVYGISKIAVAKNPTKVTYKVGEKLDTKGLVVKATLTDKTSKNLVGDSYKLSGFSSAKAGTSTVKITAGGKTTTFKVTIKK